MKPLNVALCSLFLMGFSPLKYSYTDYRGKPPVGDKIYICSEVGCQKLTSYKFTPRDKLITMELFRDATTPKLELEAVRSALAGFDRRLCKLADTCNDLPGIEFWKSGQMDCVDESRNSTSYLLMLQRWGLLKYHTVLVPDWKGWHWYARLRARTGKCVRVESDFNYPGDKPKLYACS